MLKSGSRTLVIPFDFSILSLQRETTEMDPWPSSFTPFLFPSTLSQWHYCNEQAPRTVSESVMRIEHLHRRRNRLYKST